MINKGEQEERGGSRGDGVAQSDGLEIQRPEVRTWSASGAQEQCVRVFRSQKMLCWLAVGLPVCIRTHKNGHVRTLTSMSEFGGLRKQDKTQHALNN